MDIKRFVVHQKQPLYTQKPQWPNMHSTSVYLSHIGMVSAWSVSRGCDVTRAPMDPDSVIRVQTWDRVFDLTFSLATALWDTGQPRAGQLAAMAWSWAPWWSSNIGDKRCLKPSEYQIVHCIVSADLDSPASSETRRFHPLGWLNYLLTS